MSDSCSPAPSEVERVELEATGERSSLWVKSQRGFAGRHHLERCLSLLAVVSRPGTRIALVIEDLDMATHPKEHYCVDYLDVVQLDSLVSRFCGSLEETFPTSYASQNSSLVLKWNFYTGSSEHRGFSLLLTAFTEPERGQNCSDAVGSMPEGVAMFRCDNGRCIDARWRCDRRDNCGDASDERHCRAENSHLTLVLGAALGAFVVVAILSTAICIKCQRRHQKRASTSETPRPYIITDTHGNPLGGQPASIASATSRSGQGYY